MIAGAWRRPHPAALLAAWFGLRRRHRRLPQVPNSLRSWPDYGFVWPSTFKRPAGQFTGAAGLNVPVFDGLATLTATSLGTSPAQFEVRVGGVHVRTMDVAPGETERSAPAGRPEGWHSSSSIRSITQASGRPSRYACRDDDERNALGAGLRSRAASAHALAVVITLYGGLLRLDSFVGKYRTSTTHRGPIATRNIAPLVRAIRPQSVHWTHSPSLRRRRPYHLHPVQPGDAILLPAARARAGVSRHGARRTLALDDQDFGVAWRQPWARCSPSLRLIWWAPHCSRRRGLLAALLTATELEMVTWGVDGWRDDTFTATILFSVWALLRLRARPSLANALVAGALCGISCLTRITAITFVVPAFLWLVIEHASTSRRERAKAVGIAAAMLTIVVAPYLVSCAIATGDPLLAINYHTSYYRFAEAQPIDTPMSAADYLAASL